MAKNDVQPAEGGAWDRDKRFGLRLDQTFHVGERFVILAARLDPETIPTDFGDAERVEMLVQRLNEEGTPTGHPFAVGTVASAIVEKLKASNDDDFPAVVELMRVTSKKFKKDALVLQYVGGTDPTETMDDWDVSPELLEKVDKLRPASEQIPI